MKESKYIIVTGAELIATGYKVKNRAPMDNPRSGDFIAETKYGVAYVEIKTLTDGIAIKGFEKTKAILVHVAEGGLMYVFGDKDKVAKAADVYKKYNFRFNWAQNLIISEYHSDVWGTLIAELRDKPEGLDAAEKPKKATPAEPKKTAPAESKKSKKASAAEFFKRKGEQPAEPGISIVPVKHIEPAPAEPETRDPKKLAAATASEKPKKTAPAESKKASAAEFFKRPGK